MRNRDRIVIGVVACAVAVAGFWFLALKPKRADVAAAGQRAEAAQTQLQAANDALATATGARARLDADYATMARLGKAVPDDDDAASLVFQIESAARDAGIDFRALTVGANGAPSPATPAASSSSSSSSPSSKSSSSSSAAPAAGTTGAAAPAPHAATALPPGVVAGTDGMNRLPFTFIFDGDYFSLTKLLDLLHSFTTTKGETVTVRGRLLTVEGVNLEQGRKGFPQVKATITATAYVSSEQITLPGGAGAVAQPTAATPATTAPSTQAAGTSTSVPAATVTPGAVR
jgi:hypothetical protein